MSDWWNGWEDTAKRLFVPFGAGTDSKDAPVWDLGGRAQAGFEPDAIPDVHLPHFEEDRLRLGGQLEGRSPFASSQWGSLISQLQARASGTGPSIAGDAYKQAADDTNNQLTSMSQNSASPGAARQAILQRGHVSQGLAQGYAMARNQEMQGAENQLTGALGARDTLNQNAYMGVLAKQLGLSDSELKAMIANQQNAQMYQQLRMQGEAGKYGALGSIFGGIAKMYGGGAGA